MNHLWGGGAVLFFLLSKYQNIGRIIINDVNPALINCYKQIKHHHLALIRELSKLQDAYYSLDNIEQKSDLYYSNRNEYNLIPVKKRSNINAAALFLFLNKNCFNGLYRENKQGKFNVPFGKHFHPTICDKDVIISVHEALQKVEILCGEYTAVKDYIKWDEYNFFYFDPPYRPLLGSLNFKQYTMNNFDDPQQEELKLFCDEINGKGGKFLLSNSDSETEPGISYFEYLYAEYNLQRITSKRTINAFKPGEKTLSEVLIKNY